jgi:hypothetical protein
MLKTSRNLDVNDGFWWRIGYSQLHKLRGQRHYRPAWKRVELASKCLCLAASTSTDERFAVSNHSWSLSGLCRQIRLHAGFCSQGNHQQRDSKPRRVESHGHVVEKAELYFGVIRAGFVAWLADARVKRRSRSSRPEGNEPSQL